LDLIPVTISHFPEVVSGQAATIHQSSVNLILLLFITRPSLRIPKNGCTKMLFVFFFIYLFYLYAFLGGRLPPNVNTLSWVETDAFR